MTNLSTTDFLKLIFPLAGPEDPRGGDMIRFARVSRDIAFPGDVVWFNRSEINGWEAVPFSTDGKDTFLTAHGFNRRAKNVDKSDAVALFDSAWAEVDDEDLDPYTFTPMPSVIVNTSKGRHHCYWLLTDPLPAEEVEALNYRIAYGHGFKSDKGGWGITKFLRLPNTVNLKRLPIEHEIKVIYADANAMYCADDFGHLPEAPSLVGREATAPEMGEFPDPDDVWERHQNRMPEKLRDLLDGRGVGDRSSSLWRVYRLCNRIGISREETYSLVYGTLLDKFHAPPRRHNADLDLWKDICKGFTSAEKPVAREHLNDLGNALRLVDRFGDRIQYCASEEKWYVYDDARWAPDILGTVTEMGKEVVADLYDIAATTMDADVAKHAARSASSERIRAMVRMAQSIPSVAVRIEDFDQHPRLLNLPNGTYDLDADDLREHRGEDLITALCPTEYDPNGSTDVTLAFLRRMFGGDEGKVAFLRKILGIALSGDENVKIFPILVGPQDVGKSKLEGNFRAMLGPDYATILDESTITLSRWGRSAGGPAADIYELRGKRFASCSEPSKSLRLDVAFIKKVTGGSPLTARPPFGKHMVTFEPQFTMLLEGNHLPDVPHDDSAFWVRAQVLQTAESIPKDEQDEQLPVKLEAERPGFLAWCIEGYRAYRREGLNPPASVKQETVEYEKMVDPVKAFVEDFCIKDADYELTTATLRDVFDRWCREREITRNVSQVEFGKRLTRLGYPIKTITKAKISGRRGLRPPDPTDIVGSTVEVEPEPVRLAA